MIYREEDVIRQWKETMKYESVSERMMNDDRLIRYCSPVGIHKVDEIVEITSCDCDKEYPARRRNSGLFMLLG